MTSHQVGKPGPFPVRELRNLGFEVYILDENRWLRCETGEDARILSRRPVLEYESLERERSGSAFADELARLSATMRKYNMGFGSRFFGRRADEVRKVSHVKSAQENN